jgi:outer membrane protein
MRACLVAQFLVFTSCSALVPLGWWFAETKSELGQVARQISQASQALNAPPPASPLLPERLELTLQLSIEIALKHNLGVQILSINRDLLQTRIPQAQATFHPTVGLTLIGTDTRTSSVTSPVSTKQTQNLAAFINQPLPTGTGASLTVTSSLLRQVEETLDGMNPGTRTFTGDLAITLNQPLLRGGRAYVATKPILDAEYDLHIQEADLRALAFRVIADTKRAYYTLVLAEQLIDVTKQSIQRFEKLKDTSDALFNSGLVTLRDVFSAKIDLFGDTARLAGNQADYQLARNNLLDVLGIPIATEILLLEKELPFREIPLDLSKFEAIALDKRPEILRIEQQLAKNALRVRAAKNVVLPQLDLFGTYRRFQEAGAAGSAFGLNGKDWSTGVIFSVPIGNVLRNSQLAEAEIERLRLERELVQQQRRIQLEVREAVITLRRTVAEMIALNVKIDQSKGKLETARARFALGIANNLDIVDAQKDLRTAQSDMARALVDYNIGLADLEARIASPIELTSN